MYYDVLVYIDICVSTIILRDFYEIAGLYVFTI